ncbi:unnamed protein product, partial [Dovyalis caffra]
ESKNAFQESDLTTRNSNANPIDEIIEEDEEKEEDEDTDEDEGIVIVLELVREVKNIPKPACLLTVSQANSIKQSNSEFPYFLTTFLEK